MSGSSKQNLTSCYDTRNMSAEELGKVFKFMKDYLSDINHDGSSYYITFKHGNKELLLEGRENQFRAIYASYFPGVNNIRFVLRRDDVDTKSGWNTLNEHGVIDYVRDVMSGRAGTRLSDLINMENGDLLSKEERHAELSDASEYPYSRPTFFNFIREWIRSIKNSRE